jgi:hypothetical protein
VSKNYVFSSDEVNIFSSSIAADGALTLVSTINAQSFNLDNCGGPTSLFFDHTKSTVYDLDYDGDCANSYYQSFKIEQSTGVLDYLGATGVGESIDPLTFIGNNLYGYSVDCFHESATISGFMRNADGTLANLNINPPIPEAEKNWYYCPKLAAADSANNVAVALQPDNFFPGAPIYPTQLAVYTADTSGNLTTNSTLQNMPATGVGYVTAMSTSPSGNLLAVAGTTGLQIFHFNGSNPITHFTRVLTSAQVDGIAWDNNNHLLGYGNSAGLLFVLTVTPNTVSQAPGSPYSIANPSNIAVATK